MSERVVVEFTVHDADQFKQALQAWDQNTPHALGYRIDDGVDKRKALKDFCDQMELKLRKNDHKTGWRDLPEAALFRLMTLEIEEFRLALEFLSVREAMKELPDIANFAMMLYDRLSITGGAGPAEFLRIKL